jgi:ABC-2 type transport system permease protein
MPRRRAGRCWRPADSGPTCTLDCDGPLCLAALGLLGVALGALLRHPAAAIGVLVAVVLVLPGIAAALPARIESNVEEYWPTMAGAQVTAVIHGTHKLGPWPGFGLMCLFIAAAMAAAFLLLARRDT